MPWFICLHLLLSTRGKLSEASKNIVKQYLERFLNEDLVKEYYKIFENYYQFYYNEIHDTWQSPKVDPDKLIIHQANNVCRKIKLGLNRKDRIFVFLGVYPLLAYIYFIRRSSKFQAGKNTKWEKAGIYILTGTLVFILLLFGSGYRENKLVAGSGEINIEGMYGEKLILDDIESVTLSNELPEIVSRTNGFPLRNINKGY